MDVAVEMIQERYNISSDNKDSQGDVFCIELVEFGKGSIVGKEYREGLRDSVFL